MNKQQIPFVKYCPLCKRVQKYNRGDTEPHWGKCNNSEKEEASSRRYRVHHTLCPDCRKLSKEEKIKQGGILQCQ